MEKLRKVVLVGASGTVGSAVLRTLLEDNDFDITILTRPDSKSVMPEMPNVAVQTCDYNVPALVQVFTGKDAVVCAIAVQHVSIQTVLLEAAEKAGVKRFILNEFGNSPTNQVGLPETRNMGPVRTKREMIVLAESLTAANPAFTWSALATGNFIDYSLINYPPLGFDIARNKARLIDDGSEQISASTMADIGIAVRGILRNPAETANKHLHIRSMQASQKDILGAFQALTGKQWEVEYASSQELYESGKALLAKGEQLGVLNILVCQLFAKGAGRSIVVSREKSDNELLGVREKSVEAIVQDVLEQTGRL